MLFRFQNYIYFEIDWNTLNLLNFICLTVDIVLIKVNSQKDIEWITSFDFNNDLDSYSNILDYGPYLYLSISSGALNL